MNNKDEKEARPFDGERKTGFWVPWFEIIILVILGCLVVWGTYSLGVWLVTGFK